MLLVVPAAVLPFATVHDRWIIISCVVLWLIPLPLFRHPLTPPSRITFFFAALSCAALSLAALQIIPGGGLLRPLFQPGLSEHVASVLSLTTNSAARPLALDLSGALQGIAWGGAALGFTLTVAQTCRRRQRALAWSILAAGLLTVCLALLHRVTDAPSIYWSSGIPSQVRTDYFAPFVSPNHAGALLAAGVAVGLGLGSVPAQAAAAVLAAGVWWTGSRGAVLALLAGVAVYAVKRHGRRGAVAVGLLSVPPLLAVLWVGPRVAARWVSLRIIPEDHMQDLTGNRLQMWRDGLGLLADAPVLGLGLGGFEGGFRAAKTMAQHATVDHAHNDLLQAFIEQGLLGGLLCAAAAGLLLWAAATRADKLAAGWLGALAAIGCAALVDFPLQIGALSLLTAAIAGAVLAEGRPVPGGRTLRPVFVFAGVLSVVALAARLAVSSEEVQIERGDAAYDRQETSIAAAHYRRALWLAPMSHQALLRLGREAWEAGDLSQAEALYTLAAEGYPTLLWPWVNLARLRTLGGAHAEASQAWRQVLRNNVPDNDDASPWIEEALSSSPDPVAAALAIAPERADRKRDIALVLADQLDTPGARETVRVLFADAMVDEPRWGLDYANVLMRWGEPEAALVQLAALPEEDCRPARLAGKALEQLERPAEARRRYQQARRGCPESLRDKLDEALVRVAQLAGEPDAIAAAEAELSANPSRHALRRRVITGLCGRTPLPRADILAHLEVLLLEATPTVAESRRYSQLVAGGDCEVDGE